MEEQAMVIDPGKFTDGALEILLDGLRTAPGEIAARETLLKIFAAERDRRAPQAGAEISSSPEVVEISLFDPKPAVIYAALTGVPFWMMLIIRGFIQRRMEGWEALADPRDLRAVCDFLTELATELQLVMRAGAPKGFFSRLGRKGK
jgi:hypothetical protein